MALAYLTINLDAFTGDDHPPISQYSTITLDPGADHIDAAADVIHVRTIVVSLDQQGKAATANGVPCVDGKVPIVAGVMYAVSAPNVLRDGPHYIPALTAGQVVDLSDYITPGAPLTPDQAAILTARIKALETTPPDHGALTGLGEDDHPQYALADGTRGAFAAPLGAEDNYVTDAEKAALHGHSNKAALDLVSGTNTGDQVLPTWATISGKPTVVAEGATQADARTAIGLGSAATTASTAYATAAQGAKADTAVQPDALTAAVSGKSDKSGTPKSLADFGVLPTNTAAQNRTGFTAAAASTYTDFVLPAGTYQWSAAAEGQWMMSWAGKGRIRIRGLNAVINDTTTYTNNGAFTGLFLLDDCKDFELSGIEYVGPALGSPSTLLGYQGAMLVRAINGTDGVKVDLRASNCRYGVQTGEYGDATKGQCKNFDIKVRGTMIGYAFAGYYADSIRLDLDVDGIHRVAYLAGCDDVTGVTRWRDQYIAPMAVLMTNTLTSGTDALAQVAPPANPTTSRGCSNVDLTVIDKGSTVFQNGSVCAGIALERVDPCRFENIRVKVYTVGTDTVSTKVGGFHITSVGVPATWSRYTYNWEPTVVLDNITVSGVVDHSAQTVASNSVGEVYIYTKDDAGEGSGKYATVRHLALEDLTILKSSAASPRDVIVVVREPVIPITLRGVHAPGLGLALQTSATVPTQMDSCTFSKITTAGVVASLVSLGSNNKVATLVGVTPNRVASQGIGGAGAIAMQKETTLTLTGASVTWTNAIPIGSVLLGVQARIQTTITGATGYYLGVAGDVSRFANRNDLAAGLAVGPANQAGTETSPKWYLGDTSIIVTAKTSDFTGGTMRVVITYLSFPALTA